MSGVGRAVLLLQHTTARSHSNPNKAQPYSRLIHAVSLYPNPNPSPPSRASRSPSSSPPPSTGPCVPY